MGYVLHMEDDLVEIKGASKVASSTQNQAIVETEDDSIIITGSEIEVKGLNLENGEVFIAGKFANIKFSKVKGKKQPFLKRIFK